jgi:hypothetical protein
MSPLKALMHVSSKLTLTILFSTSPPKPDVFTVPIKLKLRSLRTIIKGTSTLAVNLLGIFFFFECQILFPQTALIYLVIN